MEHVKLVMMQVLYNVLKLEYQVNV